MVHDSKTSDRISVRATMFAFKSSQLVISAWLFLSVNFRHQEVRGKSIQVKNQNKPLTPFLLFILVYWRLRIKKKKKIEWTSP